MLCKLPVSIRSFIGCVVDVLHRTRQNIVAVQDALTQRVYYIVRFSTPIQRYRLFDFYSFVTRRERSSCERKTLFHSQYLADDERQARDRSNEMFQELLQPKLALFHLEGQSLSHRGHFRLQFPVQVGRDSGIQLQFFAGYLMGLR